MALQHQHHPVSPLDPKGLEVVGALGGGIFNILKGEPPLGHIVCDMHHRQFLRLAPGDGIHRVKGEVIGVLIHELDTSERAPLILACLDELLAKQRLGALRLMALTDIQGLVSGLVCHDHSKEDTVLTVNGDHTVGGGGFIEDRIALSEHFLVISHLDPHSAADHQVKFLTGVGGGVDGLVLQLGRVLVGDPVRGRQLLAEHGRHILNGDAVLTGGDQTLALPGNGVAAELGAMTLQKVGNF